TADLAAVAIELSSYVRKSAGQPMMLLAEGPASAGGWSIARVAAILGSENITLVPNGERWVTEGLSIDLARLTPYIQSEMAIAGRIEGSVATNPVEASVSVAGVTLAPTPE